jgi:geranylgeranyl reductase family protein
VSVTPGCDVLIVGAGPAGATAARTLATAGARVLVLDRARFPRNKPCGGAVSLRALRRFPYLEPSLDRIATHRIARLYLESPLGEAVTLESDEPAALMIRRIEFDRLLTELARAAGAEIVEGIEIGQAERRADGIELRARDGRVFRAPLVIAADGVNSVVARRLGLNRGWPPSAVALDMMEETENRTLRAIAPDSLWVGYGYGGSDGYAYVFPKRDHVNVGIGYLLSFYRGSVAESPYELQTRFINRLNELAVLRGASVRENFTPFLIPVGGPLRRTASHRVLLAGDAGGFVNGFTAEGIYYAMVTGDLAGRAVAGGHPERYERAWKREVGAELRDSVIVQRYLFGNRARIDGMVRAAREHVDLALRIVDYAMGRISYQQARRSLLLSAPRLALRLAASLIGDLGARNAGGKLMVRPRGWIRRTES